jgi:acyl-CoA thioester hydrolase
MTAAAPDNPFPGRIPSVYTSSHRIQFSDLDPYDHMATGRYATHYVDHRMEGLRDHIGWDLENLRSLSFMVWVRKLHIEFLRPVRGDQEITITSFVREFRGPDAVIQCVMADARGRIVSTCVMTVAHVDRTTGRATNWPPDVAALFFEEDGAPGDQPAR